MSQSQSPHHHGVMYQKQSDHFERVSPHVVTPSRSVGELVYSLLPLEDTGLHLVDGSVLYGDGPYGSFVDYVQGLYASGQYDNLFITEAEWQTSVSTYGVCGKFVVDTVEDTVRLPKVTGFLEGTVDPAALGTLVEAGLPLVSGQFGAFYNGPENTPVSGAFYRTADVIPGTTRIVGTDTTANVANIAFDPSRSSSVYGNSTTVQPQSIKGFIYMVLANKVRNPMNLDISQAVRGAAVPVGTIIMSANTTVPQGYLLCDGSAVGRGTYPELFEAIGTTYGEGDGNTTFNLPNLIGKFVEGSATAGTVKEAGLPNITASGGSRIDPDVLTGAFTSGTNNQMAGAGLAIAQDGLSFDASLSNPIYGNSDTVQPPSLTALPCIKAFSSVVSDGTVVIGNLASEVQAKNGEWAGHNAMPSGQYIDLTLPASGGAVTAPADGYLSIRKASSNSNQWLEFSTYIDGYTSGADKILIGVTRISTLPGQPQCMCFPVKKDQVVYLNYDFAGATYYFRFIYANGSAPTV